VSIDPSPNGIVIYRTRAKKCKLVADSAKDVEFKGSASHNPDSWAAEDLVGLIAVNSHSGETVVIIRRNKRRKEVAELLRALLDKHPKETIFVAWDNAITHQDNEVEAVPRGVTGRLVLPYLPAYNLCCNPIEMIWCHFRREVTHCELFTTVKELFDAPFDFFKRFNEIPEKTLSIIGAILK